MALQKKSSGGQQQGIRLMNSAATFFFFLFLDVASLTYLVSVWFAGTVWAEPRFFAPRSRERNDPKWPAYVEGGGEGKKEHPYFKGAKVQGEHTRIITHWDNMFEGEREGEGGGCIDSWKLRRRWESGAAAPAIALEDIFSLFFNLQLMRFSAAPLCSVVSVYPILSPQPHLLYLCSSRCRSRIGLFV